MEEILKINEDTTLPNASNIETTDVNVSVDKMFHECGVQSLPRQIGNVFKISGPTGAVFDIIKNHENDFKVIRKEVECFPSKMIKTGITREAVQDLLNQFGQEAEIVIGALLRRIANENENEKLLYILENESLDYGNLNLSDSLNSSTNFFELTQKIHEIVLKMNIPFQRTYKAFAVLPYSVMGSVMGLNKYMHSEDKDSSGLFITQIGLTDFYLNPDPLAENVYVGLKDPDDITKSSIVMTDYQQQIVDALDPETGELYYFLVNRFAIVSSALHKPGKEMLYKFKVVL